MTYGTKSTENRRKKHIRPGNDLWIGKLGLICALMLFLNFWIVGSTTLPTSSSHGILDGRKEGASHCGAPITWERGLHDHHIVYRTHGESDALDNRGWSIRTATAQNPPNANL